jgi:predicted nucleotide-binding protein
MPLPIIPQEEFGAEDGGPDASRKSSRPAAKVNEKWREAINCLFHMEAEKIARLRKLRASIAAQERSFREVAGRNGKLSPAAAYPLIAIFDQLRSELPDFGFTYNHHADANSALPQIARALHALDEALGNSLAVQPEPVVQSPDPRRVFVVHGRNLAARDAMFGFLSAINLAPIEWDQAVSFTGEGTPHIGTILDKAFSEAKAVVVLITGDDLARLGTRFQTTHEEAFESQLTPQARPNVLFEAGMAFGRQPTRTILVSLGKTRPFSDVAGRNHIYITNQIEGRQALAARLKTAGCDVQTEHQTYWHRAGDFDAAVFAPDSAASPGETQARADALKPDVLKYQNIHNEGFFSTRIGIFSFQVMEFLNVQRDIPHPANNVTASMEFRHADGERFFVDRALWLTVPSQVEFPNRVIIESGRTGKLCLAAQDGDNNCFVVTDLEFQSKLKSLKFGKWNITVNITFDNGGPYIGHGNFWVEKDDTDRTYLRYEPPAFAFA